MTRVPGIPRRLAPCEDDSPNTSTAQTSHLPLQDARYPDEARRPFLPLALPGYKLAIKTYRRNVHVQRLGKRHPLKPSIRFAQVRLTQVCLSKTRYDSSGCVRRATPSS